MDGKLTVQMICAITQTLTRPCVRLSMLHCLRLSLTVGARSSGWSLPAAVPMAHNLNPLGDTMSRLRFALVVFGPTVALWVLSAVLSSSVAATVHA